MARPNETDLANAEVELAQAKTYKSVGNELVDHNNTDVPLSGLAAEGFAAMEAPVQDGYVNPSILRIIYHAYDGRAVAIPDYMAKVRLAERFPDETWVPRKWVGKRVWFLEAQPRDTEHHNLKCLLHIDQDEATKAEVAAAGFNPGRCNKAHLPSAYGVEKHMELKHKDEWRAILRNRDQHIQADARAETRAQTEAIIRLAESLVKANTSTT